MPACLHFLMWVFKILVLTVLEETTGRSLDPPLTDPKDPNDPRASDIAPATIFVSDDIRVIK